MEVGFLVNLIKLNSKQITPLGFKCGAEKGSDPGRHSNCPTDRLWRALCLQHAPQASDEEPTSQATARPFTALKLGTPETW